MIRINTQAVDPAGEAGRAIANGDGPDGEPGEFDTSSFHVPEARLDPHGTARRTPWTRIRKTVDWTMTKAAGVAFDAAQLVNRYRPNPSFTPKWSDKPLLKSWEK